MDNRTRDILLETINEFIVSAEPVGSRKVSEKLNKKLSPATVRNVMSELEDQGYLHQPHTSAGRVPTDRGYRFFVDEIVGSRAITGESELSTTVFRHDWNPENLENGLGSICHLLSMNAHQTGLVMVPGVETMHLKRIEFVRLSEKQVLAVFLSNMGQVQNRVVRLETDISQDRLTSIANYLNHEFTGQSLRGIREELVRRVRNEKERYDQIMKRAHDLWTRMFVGDEDDSAKLLIDGINHLLDQPEFSADLERMKSLLKTLEEKSKLVKLLDLCMQKEGLSVIIGDEHLEEEMQACSLIAQTYMRGDENLGAVAVVGPRRMDYPHIIRLVQSTAENISTLLSKQST